MISIDAQLRHEREQNRDLRDQLFRLVVENAHLRAQVQHHGRRRGEPGRLDFAQVRSLAFEQSAVNHRGSGPHPSVPHRRIP